MKRVCSNDSFHGKGVSRGKGELTMKLHLLTRQMRRWIELPCSAIVCRLLTFYNVENKCGTTDTLLQLNDYYFFITEKRHLVFILLQSSSQS